MFKHTGNRIRLIGLLLFFFFNTFIYLTEKDNFENFLNYRKKR